MTFTEYLAQRRSYTETGFALHAATAAMPVTVASLGHALAWLRATCPERHLDTPLHYAWKNHRAAERWRLAVIATNLG